VEPLPKDKVYLAYIPLPTELCMLCARRTKEGLDLACIKHCMAAVIKYGQIEDLAKEMDKPRMVLQAPRP
jgi:Fe-S-cluster-containing dehydrogenase component